MTCRDSLLDMGFFGTWEEQAPGWNPSWSPQDYTSILELDSPHHELDYGDTLPSCSSRGVDPLLGEAYDSSSGSPFFRPISSASSQYPSPPVLQPVDVPRTPDFDRSSYVLLSSWGRPRLQGGAPGSFKYETARCTLAFSNDIAVELVLFMLCFFDVFLSRVWPPPTTDFCTRALDVSTRLNLFRGGASTTLSGAATLDACAILVHTLHHPVPVPRLDGFFMDGNTPHPHSGTAACQAFQSWMAPLEDDPVTSPGAVVNHPSASTVLACTRAQWGLW